MKKNIGTTDRRIRIVLAAVIAVLYFTHTISSTTAIILGVTGIVLLLTSFINFCPLYLPFGINTFKKTPDKQ